MKVQDLMTAEFASCRPDTTLHEVARLFVEHDCGCLPVVESEKSGKLVGVITDRDIVVRSIAEGRNPMELTAEECMTSSSLSTVTPETDIEECCHIMERARVRRLPVVETRAGARCIGMISQADIATGGSEHQTAEVVRTISEAPGQGLM